MIQDIKFEESENSIESPARLFTYSDAAHEIQQLDGTMWSYDDLIEYIVQIGNSDDALQMLLDHARRIRGRDQLEDDFSAIQVGS
jgi:hypothetical protein